MAAAIPETPAQITPAWLSETLSGRFPGAEAIRVEVVDAHSGTTGRARLRVDWRNDAGVPSAVFAKLAPTDPVQREMVVSTGMGKREARFYAEAATHLSARVAAPYGSSWNEDGSAYLMLMEDLAESGCTFPGWEDSEIPDHAQRMMDALAQLHAGHWESPLFDGPLSWIEPPMRSDFGPMLVRSALEQFGAEMPPVFRAQAELYIAEAGALSDRLDQGPQTLVHGDSHLGNLFLDGDRIGFLDWACVCRAPGLRDVAYFLCNSIPTELRRAEERPLLERYLQGLRNFGAPAPPFDEAFDEYRRLVLCGWIAGTVTAAAGSRMQSVETGLRAMNRSTRTIDDLETFDLLRADLGIR